MVLRANPKPYPQPDLKPNPYYTHARPYMRAHGAARQLQEANGPEVTIVILTPTLTHARTWCARMALPAYCRKSMDHVPS